MTEVKKWYKIHDMLFHEIRNAIEHLVSGDPGSPLEGQHWYNNVSKRFRIRDDSGNHSLAYVDELASGSVTSVSGTSPVNSSGGTTPVISVDAASAATASYLIRRDSSSRAKVADASADDDIAAWGQVKAWLAGMRDMKDSVRVMSSTNITIASPGATIDGVTMTAGDRVGLLAQTAGAENFIWIWNGAAVPMTRATDSDTSAKVNAGAYFQVEEGTKADHTFILTTNNPITLGTTALVLADAGTTVVDVSAPLSKTGTTISLTFDASLINSGGTLQVSKTKYPQLFSALIGGAGPTTDYTVTNNGWAANVISVVQIIEVSTGLDVTDGVSITRASNGDFTVSFDASSVAGTAYRYVLLALPA